MKLTIDTRRHCIETGAKKKYERLLRQYFKPGCSENEKHVLEQQIQALIYFLENADFSDLRNQYHISGQAAPSSVLVIPEAFEQMYIHLNHQVFYPVWKKKKGDLSLSKENSF